MSHTDGPWHVSGKQSIRGPKGEYIAKTNWTNGANNAVLIAAAPAMYSELREILSWALTERAPLRQQEIDSINFVLNQAEGRA
jgi:hypothetical protein